MYCIRMVIEKNSQANISTEIMKKLNSTRYKITVAAISLNNALKK